MDRADEAFAEILLGKTAAGRDPSRWNTPLIHHPHRTMTKRDVFNWYSQPTVREALMAQLKAGPSIVLQKFGGDAAVLRRLTGTNEPIRITKDSGDVDDQSDYQYWIERRTVEFHPVLGEKTNRIFVDVDPKPGFSWKDTKRTVRAVHDLMEAHPEVMSTELRYSGGDGFHVLGTLAKEVHVDDARRLAQKIAEPIVAGDARATFGEAGPKQVRLDVSTLKQTGSLRGLYSLNRETGLACIPVEEEHLSSFSPEEATVRSILGYRPKNARSLRP